MLKDDSVWIWGPTQQKAFEDLRHLCINTPVLAFYSPTAETIVSADASSYGLGAVLLQVQPDGRRAPVAYASRALTTAERAYAQIEKEALAITFACEKFQQYLLGQTSPFIVETDHKPLLSIMNIQDWSQCPPRLQRLKIRLARFFYTVVYVPGKELLVADALSRAPTEDENFAGHADLDYYVQAVMLPGLPVSDVLFTRLRQATRDDSQLSVLLRYLQSSWPPDRAHTPMEVRPYWDSRHMLSVVEGLILKGSQIVISNELRSEMVDRAHEGHLGLSKTKMRAVWWPGMARNLEDVVSHCDVCAKYKHQQTKEPLMSTELPDRPWQKVASDLFEVASQHYLLVVDYYSRFPEVRKLNGLRTTSVIAACQEIFGCHGIPELLISDNGPQYVNAAFAQFSEHYGFQHATSSPRYPQGNGLAERCVQTVKGLLKKALEAGSDYQLALLAYRTTPHASTGVSPAQLLMGRRLHTRLPEMKRDMNSEQILRPTVQAADQKSKQKQAFYYDRRHGTKVLARLPPGMPVLVWDLVTRTPGTVLQQLGARSYSIKLSSGRILRRNRYQIQPRPTEKKGQQEEDQFDQEDDSVYSFDQGDMAEAELIANVQDGMRAEARRAEEVGNDGDAHAPGTVTRSGREVRQPAWRKDYV